VRFPLWEKIKREPLASALLAVALLAMGGYVAWTQLPKVGPPAPPVPTADIVLPAEVRGGAGELLDLEAETRGESVQWWASPGLQHRGLCAGGKRCVVAAARQGRYTVIAWTSLDGKPTAAAECSVVVGDAPQPTPPTPTPPGPPPPSPVPQGFRVLFLYETSAKLTRGQLAVVNSTAVVDYLNRRCVKDTDGRPGWRKWDRDIDPAKDLKVWQELSASVKGKATAPCLVVAVDQRAEVLPFPPDEAAALEVLKRYGGP